MITFKPATTHGKWALILALAVVAMVLLVTLVFEPLGWLTTPEDENQSAAAQIFQAFPAYFNALFGLGSLVLGIMAIRKRDRSIGVFLATLIGLVIAVMIVGGLVFPEV